jgi:hypothetical protein
MFFLVQKAIFLFICSSFNEAVCSSGKAHTVPNDRTINKLERTWKEAAVIAFLEGMRKTTRNLSQGSRYLVRELNPGLPKYEAGVLSLRYKISDQV